MFGKCCLFWTCRAEDCLFKCLTKLSLGSFAHPDFTEVAAVKWAIHHKLVKLKLNCRVCDQENVFKVAERLRDGVPEVVLRCSSTSCKGAQSAQGFYFKQYKDMRRQLVAIYMLMHEYPMHVMRSELGETSWRSSSRSTSMRTSRSASSTSPVAR